MECLKGYSMYMNYLFSERVKCVSLLYNIYILYNEFESIEKEW
jgi:hypothetical protein